MHINVVHETRYTYDQPARQVVQILRLTPRNHRGQYVQFWNIDIDHDCRIVEHEDSFGNITHTFSATGPIEALKVRIEGSVETEETNGVVAGTAERLPLPLFLRQTGLTSADAAIRRLARKCASDNPLDAAHALMHAVGEAIEFEKTATDTSTTAAEALAAGQGVCQDFAHVFITAARTLAIPSRYVSGYFVHGDGATDHEAGHAWAEVHVPDLGWVAFDPANNTCPGESYVRVAVGLDYLDAAPVRGVQAGGMEETMSVGVNVIGIQQQQ